MMKTLKYLMTCALLVSMSVSAQIDFETHLESSELLSNLDFSMMQIDEDEYVYVSLVKSSGQVEIKLFDEDFIFMQNIVLPTLPGYSVNVINVWYISRTLFDCDASNIEMMINYGYSPPFENGPAPKVQIVREDGTVLFEETEAVAMPTVSYPSNRYMTPVMNTPTGTKMFLYKTINGIGDDGIKVFSLCGTLPQPCCTSSSEGITTHTESAGHSPRSQAMPNPTADFVRIKWTQITSGNHTNVEIYSSGGQFLRQVPVSAGQQEILLDLSGYSSGTYIYRITDQSGKVETGKVVKQ